MNFDDLMRQAGLEAIADKDSRAAAGQEMTSPEQDRYSAACYFAGLVVDKAARVQALEADVLGLLAGLVEIWNKKADGRAGSPNHGHNIPGIWDSDNGVLAGKPCAECALYDRARAIVGRMGEEAGRGGNG